jgi:hypothetical protein
MHLHCSHYAHYGYVQFVRLGDHGMGGIHLTLYARREIASRVKLVKFSEVACGLGNVVQNKGAVAAFLRCVVCILYTEI